MRRQTGTKAQVKDSWISKIGFIQLLCTNKSQRQKKFVDFFLLWFTPFSLADDADTYTTAYILGAKTNTCRTTLSRSIVVRMIFGMPLRQSDSYECTTFKAWIEAVSHPKLYSNFLPLLHTRSHTCWNIYVLRLCTMSFHFVTTTLY